jgi:phage portal protein BeeE
VCGNSPASAGLFISSTRLQHEGKCRRFESQFFKSVFSAASRATHRLELDLSGLPRGDPQQHWQAWQIAIQNGVLSPEEVRTEEGFPPGAPQKPLTTT